MTCTGRAHLREGPAGVAAAEYRPVPAAAPPWRPLLLGGHQEPRAPPPLDRPHAGGAPQPALQLDHHDAPGESRPRPRPRQLARDQSCDSNRLVQTSLIKQIGSENTRDHWGGGLTPSGGGGHSSALGHTRGTPPVATATTMWWAIGLGDWSELVGVESSLSLEFRKGGMLSYALWTTVDVRAREGAVHGQG
eukprot:1178317-Prorocentrum_minimum.AAC.1